MAPTLSIEQALLQHQNKNRHASGQNFHAKYTVLRDRVLSTEYTQTGAGFPEGNDHGPQHIIRVLEYLDALVKGQSAKVLRPYELFLAMMAVLYHDVGILLGRKHHNLTSDWLLSLEKNDYIFDETDRELMGVAVRSHSSTQRIEDACATYREEEPLRGHKVRIRMVAALVRLADELDEDQRRAPADLYAKRKPPSDEMPPEVKDVAHPLPDTSEFFWRFNERIRGVSPEPKRKEIEFSIKFKPEDVDRMVSLPGKSAQPFIHAVLEKLLKINGERVYCNQFLPLPLQYTQLALVVHPFDRHPTWRHRWEQKLADGTTLEELLARLPPELRPDGGGGGPSGPPAPPQGPKVGPEPSAEARSEGGATRGDSTRTTVSANATMPPCASSDPPIATLPPPAASPSMIPSLLAVQRGEHELVDRAALLREVRAALADDTWRGVVLHGMSGVGKTTFAETIASVDHARGLYPGGAFEVSGATETLFRAGLAAVAEAMGSPGGMSDDARTDFARRALQQATQRTLLVIDDLDPVAPWFDPALRSLPTHVRVLATTTSAQSGFLSGKGKACWISVPELSPEGAMELVRSLAPERTEGEIAQLNAFFEGHTLGLEVAARTLALEAALSVEAYLRELAEAREVRSGPEIGTERTALEALKALWGRLSPNAQCALSVCGAFGDAAVPVGWLELALRARGLDDAGARGGLGELVRWSIARRIVEAGGDLLRFHSIVRAFAHARCRDEDRRAVAEGLIGWFEGTWDSEDGLARKARAAFTRIEALRRVGEHDPRVVRRLALALRFNGRSADVNEAITLTRAWLRQNPIAHDETNGAGAWVGHELARALSYLKTRDALEEAERLLRERLGAFPADSVEMAAARSVTLNDLGWVLLDLGGRERLREAEGYLRRALVINEAAFGTDGPTIATMLSNLALVLMGLGGPERLREAEGHLRRALAIDEAASGKDTPTIVTTLDNLSMLLKKLGGRERLREAESHLRRALTIEEAVLGKDAPTIATTLGHLGLVLTALGRPEHLREAEGHMRHALTMEEAALGKDAPTIAATLCNLAQVLTDLGGPERLREAEGHLRRALTIEEAALGKEAPTIVTTLAILATVLRDLGGRERLREAETHARRALEIDRQAFPSESPHRADCVRTLATVLYALGDQKRRREADRLFASLREPSRAASTRPRARR